MNGSDVITPTKADARLAEEAGRKLAAHLGRGEGLRVELTETSEELRLPPVALRLLVRVLDELGRGNAVELTPVRAELTTQQAADLLNVSRPHLVKLLDEGAMPSRKVGTHRRVRLADVLAFRDEWHARRHAALDELTAMSQDLDMGY
ncbi:excisionase family DNA-binding protein [Paludisphaera sp.]|uniref:excisionase family DNA-binding protein n=1 Tax=Paludisphaera sp. TaxID=2017432 RepID=UPI00301D1784